MPRYAHSGPDWVEITGGFTLGHTQYPGNWPDLASPSERSAAGVVEIVEADGTPPDDQVLTGWTLGDDDGVPTLSPVFDEAPEPPRRLIPKSVVQERVNDIGKLDAVLAVLNAQAINFARWFAPNWPNVYFDDAGLLAVLAAGGCTAPEIVTITAE